MLKRVLRTRLNVRSINPSLTGRRQTLGIGCLILFAASLGQLTAPINGFASCGGYCLKEQDECLESAEDSYLRELERCQELPGEENPTVMEYCLDAVDAKYDDEQKKCEDEYNWCCGELVS